MKKNKTLALRMTSEQNNKLEEIRVDLGLNTASDVIRMLIDNYDKSPTEYMKELQHIKNTLKELL